MIAVAALAAATIHAAPAAASSFDGISIEARLISVDTASHSATVRIDPAPVGSYELGHDTGLLARGVVLYTTTVDGSVQHPYRADNFIDPFKTTLPLEGDTSTYPFHHLTVEIDALAATARGVRSGKLVPVRLHIISDVAGYRASPRSITRQGTVVKIGLHVDPSWATVLFALFIMAVMWALALAAVAVTVNLVTRRRRFEPAFAPLLATLLFAFPVVRNALPGIPPVGALFDYAAFFWAESIVALALIALIAGWATGAPLAGRGEPRD